MKPEEALLTLEGRGPDKGKMGTEMLAPPLAADWLLLEEKAEGKLEAIENTQFKHLQFSYFVFYFILFKSNLFTGSRDD